MRFGRSFACALLATVMSAGCSDTREETQSHMRDHFERASDLHAAIINGDLARARESASWIREHEPMTSSPPSWDPYVERLRGAADQVIHASDVESVASAAGLIVRTCGTCHAALAEEMTFTASPSPPDDPATISHMQRHNWAAERLWEGLAIPSEEAWATGIQTLNESALGPEDLAAATLSPSELSTLTERVHELGEEGAQAVSWNARTSVYGRLISTCAACHQQFQRNEPS
jgi:cytochrome c553